MRLSRSVKAAIKLFTVSAFLFVFAIANPILASGLPSLAYYDEGTFVVDAFNKLRIRPNPKAYWWLEHIGNENGVQTLAREVECAMQSCITIESEGWNKFLRLEMLANNNVDILTLVNFSENLDNYDNPTPGSLPGSWSPTLGHPVVFETKMRFSPNMGIDGSGGAVGAAGIWLWTNPFSQGVANPYEIYDGIGFNWTYSFEGAFITGMNATVAKQAFPFYQYPITSINPSNWNTYKIIWSQTDAAGNQRVDFYINGSFLSTVNLTSGVLSTQNLSLEVWVDNQKLDSTGIHRIAVPEDQYMDLDYVLISKI